MEAVDYRTLKERQRVERGSYHPSPALRAHRILSYCYNGRITDG